METFFARLFPSSTFREWHEVDYLRPAGSHRRAQLALFLILWIAVCDLTWALTNVAILYIVPLMLLAQVGQQRRLWRNAAAMIVLTYGIYFLKNVITPQGEDQPFLNYRLVNRTFVALVLLGLARLLQLWIRWREEQRDQELPEPVRSQDKEIGATFAVLCCVPLVAIIAAVDFFTPANYNLAIFYSIPLFIGAWTGSRRLLWSMLAVLLALTFVELYFSVPSSISGLSAALTRNRVVAASCLIAIAASLHIWLGRQGSDGDETALV